MSTTTERPEGPDLPTNPDDDTARGADARDTVVAAPGSKTPGGGVGAESFGGAGVLAGSEVSGGRGADLVGAGLEAPGGGVAGLGGGVGAESFGGAGVLAGSEVSGGRGADLVGAGLEAPGGGVAGLAGVGAESFGGAGVLAGSEVSRGQGADLVGAGLEAPGGRGARLIHGEATTEIPVHLLFRDGPDPVSVPLRPAVVGRRQGSGELPRVPRRVVPRADARPVPVVDPDLVERSGWILPGAVGVLGGLAGAAGGAASLWWGGLLPRITVLPLPAAGLGPVQWAAVAGSGTLALFGFGGLARGRAGRAWVLTLFGRYRGTVRRTGLMWVNPLFLRRRVDVRLRHWRSEPLPAVDANGVALRVVVLVVWRVRDAARAALAVEDHQEYLRENVEAAMARVLSQFPADAPPVTAGGTPIYEDAPTLRNAEAVGDALTRRLAADVAPVGIEVFSAQPTRIEYAPEVAAAMQRRRIAALDAQHRDTVLTTVVDSVEDTVTRLTTRGLVELDDYERKALVKDLTVAFYTGRKGDAS